MAATAAAPRAAAQPVQGDVRSVGFQAGVQSRQVIREGRWFPVLLDLSAQGDQHFQGELRIERRDMDGDIAAYTESPVTLTANAGLKRVWAYAVTIHADSGSSVNVDVLSDDGILINRIAVPPFDIISADTQLIVDISEKPVAALNVLDSGAASYTGYSWGTRRYYRNICVARMPAPDLPDRWIGLEAIDAIVWDEPDFTNVSDAQLAALIEWVRNGGRLVVGVGPAWSMIQNSLLEEVMPIEGGGAALEARSLPSFLAKYAAATTTALDAPIALSSATPRSDAWVSVRDRLDSGVDVSLVSSRYVGSGMVTAVGARLRDLTAVEAQLIRPAEFFAGLFDVYRNTPEFNKAEGDAVTAVIERAPINLYSAVVEPTEFRAGATLRVATALGFVFIYGVLATIVSWIWLKRRSLTYLSWSVFAGFAVVAGVLSLGAVRISRGFGSVRSFNFVDLEAGSAEARAFGYFGYRSATRSSVDISLSGEDSFLRALSTGVASEPRYATPARYRALTGGAALDSTLMRATLKQFEGRWNGKIDGTVRGQIAITSDGELTSESWLKNDLSVDLKGGCLLFLDPRHPGGPPARPAGMTEPFKPSGDYWGSTRVPESINVLMIPIGPLAAGQRLTLRDAPLGPASRDDQTLDAVYAKHRSAETQWRLDPKPAKRDMLPTLWQAQNGDWVHALTAVGLFSKPTWDRTDAAALLCSTRGLYLHNVSGKRNFSTVGNALTTSGLVDLDVTHWLAGSARRGQGVLLLLSEAPGPAVLQVAGRAVSRRSGRTIYRVRVPIAYGRPANR